MTFLNEYSIESVFVGASVFVQIIGFIVGFFLINYQFSKQRTESNRNVKNSVDVEFYSNIASRMHNLSPVPFTAKLKSLIVAIEKSTLSKKEGGKYLAPIIKYEDLNKEGLAVHDKMFDYIMVLDCYDFTLNNTELFKKFIQYKVVEYSVLLTDIIYMLAFFLTSEHGIRNSDLLFNADHKKFVILKEKINEIAVLSHSLAPE